MTRHRPINYIDQKGQKKSVLPTIALTETSILLLLAEQNTSQFKLEYTFSTELFIYFSNFFSISSKIGLFCQYVHSFHWCRKWIRCIWTQSWSSKRGWSLGYHRDTRLGCSCTSRRLGNRQRPFHEWFAHPYQENHSSNYTLHNMHPFLFE